MRWNTLTKKEKEIRGGQGNDKDRKEEGERFI